MTEDEIKNELEKAGAIIQNNHFVYASGLHGDTYIDKDMIYPNTGLTSALCQQLASMYWHDKVDAVVAPEKGGIILSQWVAYHLGYPIEGNKTISFYAEKSGDSFILKRGNGAERIKGKKVLIVEDNLTTGGSVKKVVELVRSLGAEVDGVAAICNRGGVTKEMLGVPQLKTLINIDLVTYNEEDCPLCAKYVPVNLTLGKGADFVNRTKHEKIFYFMGEHRFLSNFYPVEVEFDGIIYPSTEHAFQAAKTLDEVRREKIRLLKKPGEAKAEGANIRKDGTLREGWDAGLQLKTMEFLLKQKFSDENPELRDLLLGTGEALLVEGNTWEDTFFGVYNGVGENHLGKLLMKRRKELRA